MSKSIVDMSDAEILEEINRLQALKIPSSPVARAPKRPKDVAARQAKKSKWKDALGID